MKTNLFYIAIASLALLDLSCTHNNNQLTQQEKNLLYASLPSAATSTAVGRPADFTKEYIENMKLVLNGSLPVDTIFAYSLGNGYSINETLLSGAVALNNPTLVDNLLTVGADPNIYVTEAPLSLAQRMKSPTIVTRLQSMGAHTGSPSSKAIKVSMPPR